MGNKCLIGIYWEVYQKIPEEVYQRIPGLNKFPGDFLAIAIPVLTDINPVVFPNKKVCTRFPLECSIYSINGTSTRRL